jgi:hypothetical protein
MADDFEDFFRPDADELPADGVAPARLGGVIVVESETEMCAEEFSARFGGPMPLSPVEFDDSADDNAPPSMPADPKQVEAAERDAYARWPIIEGARTLGPNLKIKQATPEAITARKIQFEKAVAHFRRVQAEAAQ